MSDVSQLRQVAQLLDAENRRLHERLAKLIEENAALKGKRVGVISLEMSRDEIMAIMLTIATQTPERVLEATPGVLNTTFVERAQTFQAMLDEVGGAIYLIDLPRSDLMTVEKAIRQMIEDGCELICTDYMQRITVPGKPDDYGRMTDISNTLQGLAKPVIS